MKPGKITKFGTCRLLLTTLMAVAIALTCAFPFFSSPLRAERGAIAAEAKAGVPAAGATQIVNGVKKHVNIGYYLAGNGGSKTKLRDLDKFLTAGGTGWDVINVAFLETKGRDGFTPLPTFDLYNAYEPILHLYDGQPKPGDDDPDQIKRKTEFKNDIKLLQSQGKKIVLSCGGANGHVVIDTVEKREIFLTGLLQIIREYNFDGFDIDFEQTSISIMNTEIGNVQSNAQASNLLHVVKTLKEKFGKYFIISTAPEQYYTLSHAGSNDGDGAYLAFLDAVRDDLTYIHTQIYNGNHGILNAPGVPERYRVVNTATLEGYIKSSRLLVDGFESKRGYFKGLRADQVAFGVPACDGAGGSPNPPSVYAEALDALIDEYPTFRGIMTWSVGWDEVTGKSGFLNAISAVLAKHSEPYPNVKTPSITVQPMDYNIMPNEPATLTVEAMGRGAALSYQWYETPTKTNIGGTEIPGATGTELKPQTADMGKRYYYCEITGFDKDAAVNKRAVNRTRSAHVNVRIPAAKYPLWDSSKDHYIGGDKVSWNEKNWIAQWWTSTEPGKSEADTSWVEEVQSEPINAREPVIMKELGDKKVGIGGNTALSVEAESTSGTLSYQWYSTDSMTNLNGNKINNATNPTYSAPNNSAGTNYYFCVVTNTDHSSAVTGDKTADAFSRIAKVVVGDALEEPAPKVGWSKGKIYTAGEILCGENHYYRALKRTQGREPSANPSDWEELSPAEVSDIKNLAVTYETDKKYRSLTIVIHEGIYYQATRYATKRPTSLNGWRVIA